MHLLRCLCSSHTCRHSLVPIVPAALLDYVQLPSTYIMGVHSSLKKNIGELVSIYQYLASLIVFKVYACTCSLYSGVSIDEVPCISYNYHIPFDSFEKFFFISSYCAF